MYTCSMETIYLSLRAQVAVGTFFMKYPVGKYSLTEKRQLNYVNTNMKHRKYFKDKHIKTGV